MTGGGRDVQVTEHVIPILRQMAQADSMVVMLPRDDANPLTATFGSHLGAGTPVLRRVADACGWSLFQ